MENLIPSTFDNFKQRTLGRGIETCSTTEYKGFEIFMRAYPLSGIRYKIFKFEDGRKIKVRERGVNFAVPTDFLQHAKDYIDTVLIKKEQSVTP